MQVGRRRARRGREGRKEGREGRGMAVRPGRWAVEMTKSYIAVSAKQIGLFFHTASFRSNLPNRVGHGRACPPTLAPTGICITAPAGMALPHS